MAKWPIDKRAADMEKEHQKNAERDAQDKAMRRMSAARMKRAIVEDDKKRSK
jgi:hypothetical protein